MGQVLRLDAIFQDERREGQQQEVYSGLGYFVRLFVLTLVRTSKEGYRLNVCEYCLVHVALLLKLGAQGR